MSLKTELKLHLLHEQGVRADDMLDAAVRRHSAHDGAKQALRQVAKIISQISVAVDRDIDEGRMPVEPLEVAAYAKAMIESCTNAAIAAAAHQENMQISCGGEITAYTSLVQSLKKDMNNEQSKLDAQVIVEKEATPGEGEVDSINRVAGTHPGPSIAVQRKASKKNGAA